MSSFLTWTVESRKKDGKKRLLALPSPIDSSLIPSNVIRVSLFLLRVVARVLSPAG